MELYLFLNRYLPQIKIPYILCFQPERINTMTETVRGYSFLDTQCDCYLFEVEVVFGVAQHGQEIAVNAC